MLKAAACSRALSRAFWNLRCIANQLDNLERSGRGKIIYPQKMRGMRGYNQWKLGGTFLRAEFRASGENDGN